ncbi:axin interactor, dorsalization-associated protein isoform X1 [Lingula anatina]|uniref:Axin interactor, dorsalization-associated protein isoform X1 n=1 Tax=Lingula anatina TaxID=7574 RepID=A0A1S3K3H2_LINAN|nr:axin interactor, dorsalization-associated protein isoform X1 [Lingula anatina]|eukprot:XP_013416811.1 axin interactor, dorsalization-associated protein isoform X1 [Lingula anatina]
MGDPEVDPKRLISLWAKHFKEGTDFDLWGQPLEAIEVYRKLSHELKAQADPDSEVFSDEQKKVIGKIAACLDVRCEALQHLGTVDGISIKDLKKVEPWLKNLFVSKAKEFPIDVRAVQAQVDAQSPRRSETGSTPTEEYEEEEEVVDSKTRGNLLPKPRPMQGQTAVTIRIEKIGIKDASQYIDSYITVSVKDQAGIEKAKTQDTAPATRKEENYIYFGVDVHLQKSLEQLGQDFAVFFEFKHYKPKKKQVSTKCWAFLEKDEIKDGAAVIELYKKPTDFKRKNIKLLTVKPLYLHLKLSLN